MNDLEKELLKHFASLSKEDAHALVQFAAFLSQTGGQAAAIPNTGASFPRPLINETSSAETSPNSVPKPESIPRPKTEKVVEALKRMSATYPMLDKKTLLSKASGLVAKNIMYGEPAVLVINEIEEIFKTAYDEFVKNYGNNKDD